MSRFLKRRSLRRRSRCVAVLTLGRACARKRTSESVAGSCAASAAARQEAQHRPRGDGGGNRRLGYRHPPGRPRPAGRQGHGEAGRTALCRALRRLPRRVRRKRRPLADPVRRQRLAREPRPGQIGRIVLALCRRPLSTISAAPCRSAPSQTLTNDELYAITAYVLFLNDIINSEDFELSDKNFRTIKLPNEGNFFDDDREVAEKSFWRKDPA